MNDNWKATPRPTGDLAKLFFQWREGALSNHATTIRFFSNNEEANVLSDVDLSFTPEIPSTAVDFGQGYDGLSCDTTFGHCIPSVRYAAGTVSR